MRRSIDEFVRNSNLCFSSLGLFDLFFSPDCLIGLFSLVVRALVGHEIIRTWEHVS